MSSQSVSPECQRVRDSASDYLEGHINDQEREALGEHLGSCLGCGDFLEDIQTTVGWLAKLREHSTTEGDEVRLVRCYDEYFPEPEAPEGLEDWGEAKRLWGELAGLPDRVRRDKIREDSKFVNAQLCQWLMARAKQVSSLNPQLALPLAAAARQIASLREENLADTQHSVLTLVVMAACLVVLRELSGAQEVLRRVEEIEGERSLTVEERASYLATKGLYYSITGEFKESHVCLSEALSLRRRHSNRETVVSELVNLGNIELTAGNLKAAVSHFREAESMLQTEKDAPRLQLAVFSNLALALCESRKTQKARRVLEKVRGLSQRLGGWYPRIYLRWLEGTLAFSEGRYEAAREVFEYVRSEFLAKGHMVWYVEASLDLARVYLRRGQLQILRRLASELIAETSGADERIRTAVHSFAEYVRGRTLSSQAISSIVIALSSVKLRQRP